MIIKPTRWSPPPPPQLNPQRQSTTPRNGTIENDFKPTFYNPNEIKHRRRVSSYQYSVLEEEYRANNKPNASKRHQLADRLGMTPRTVQIWFQNKRAKAKQQQQQSNKTISPSQQSHGVPDSSSTATTPQEMVTFDDGRLDPIYLLGDMATFASLSSSPPAIAKSGPVVPPDSCNAVTAPMAGSEVISDHGTGEIASTSSSSLSSPRLPDTYYAYNDPFPMWLHPHANQQQQQIATDNTVIGDPFALLQQLTDHMGNDQRRDSILHWIQKTPTDPGVPIWPSSVSTSMNHTFLPDPPLLIHFLI